MTVHDKYKDLAQFYIRFHVRNKQECFVLYKPFQPSLNAVAYPR
jgi:hypothetical protein